MRCEQLDGVCLVRLEAGKANSMDAAFLAGLDRLFGEFEASDARAAVITGYETYFSAGLSLSGLQGLPRDALRDVIAALHRTMLRIFACPRPVVAAVNGHAIAGGCVLAMQADHRVAADGPFKIGLSETQIGLGLPPVVVETMRFRVPPASWTSTMLEGRLFAPREALTHQLVDEVVTTDRVLDDAVAAARRFAAVPALAWARVKTSLRAPAVAAASADVERLHEEWLDTWFHPETRRIHAEAVAKLAAKKRN
jgi:enoyl-CoA hydratase